MNSKIIKIIFSLFFFIILTIPGLSLLLNIDYRNNSLKTGSISYPNFQRTELQQIPETIQNFFNQNFGLRQLMISAKYKIEQDVLKAPRSLAMLNDPSDLFLDGKNGFLFLNPIVPGDHIRDYNTVFFTNQELETIKKNLERENEWFKQRSIPYFIVIAPDKETIYPEYYPFPNHLLTNYKLEQLKNYLPKFSNLNLIDLKEALIDQKQEDKLIYYKGDTHWNQIGAFLGYQEIMRQFSKINSSVYIPKLSDFEINTTPKDNEAVTGDLVRIATRSEEPYRIGVRLIPKPALLQEKKLGKVFIYGDSFSKNVIEGEITGLLSFLPFSFENIHFDAYITDLERSQNLISPLEYSKIEAEKPDLVIRETAQRNLRILLGFKYSLF